MTRAELRSRIDQATRARLAADGDPLIPKEATMPRSRKTATTGSTSRKKKADAAVQTDPVTDSDDLLAAVAPATPAAPAAAEAWDPGPLVDLLMKDVQAAVEGAKRVDPKSGSYFRIMVDKTTLAYVNVSKRALTLDLATPRDRVPDGIAVKDGPNASLPVKYKLDPTTPSLGLREAVELVKIAATKEAVAA